jgi:hypothetical protein
MLNVTSSGEAPSGGSGLTRKSAVGGRFSPVTGGVEGGVLGIVGGTSGGVEGGGEGDVGGVGGPLPPPLLATAMPPPATAAAPAPMATAVPVLMPATAKPAGSEGKTVTEAFVTKGATGRSFRHSPSLATTSAAVSGVRLSTNWRSEAPR